MPQINRPTRRLLLAIALSVALHVAVISPWSFYGSVDITPGRQIHLSATVLPSKQPPDSQPKPTAPTKPERDRRGSEKAPQRITSPNPNPAIAAPGSAAAPTSPEPPAPVEAAEAYALDLPVPPEYPEEALRRNLEGCVLASVLVAESGEVRSVDIIAAEPAGIFEQAVIESQKTARYGAAKRNGEAVESRVLTVASFVLGSGRRINCALKFAPVAKQLYDRGTQKQ